MAAKKTTTTTKRKKAPKPEPVSAPKSINCEVWGIAFILLGIFTIVSWFNTEGSFISFFSRLIKGLVGIGIYVIAPIFFLLAIIMFKRQGEKDKAQREGYLDTDYLIGLRIVSCLLIPLLSSSIFQVLMTKNKMEYGAMEFTELLDVLFQKGIEFKSGGALGGLLGIFLETNFGSISTKILLFALFIIFLFIALNGDMHTGIERIKRAIIAFSAPGRETAAEAPMAERWPEPAMTAPAEPAKKRSRKKAAADAPVDIPLNTPVDIPLGPVEPAASKKRGKPAKDPEYRFPYDIPLGDDFDAGSLSGSPKKVVVRTVKKSESTAAAKRADTEEPLQPVVPVFVNPFVTGSTGNTPRPEPAKAAPSLSGPVPVPEFKVDEKPAKKAQTKSGRDNAAAGAGTNPADGDYVFPDIELLRSNPSASSDGLENVERNKVRLTEILRSFGINSSVIKITQGPTITRYDIKLEEGVKLSKVTGLEGDIALQLGAVNVRVAPITGEPSTVGIEVPNRNTSTVYLREVIESRVFKDATSKISFAIGKDIGGNCIVGNIAKLPHLLIAGTTGSGKSVCINSLILSLLYKARPDEVKLIMIDPKMVELGIYNGIPHLFAPVVTDPKKAAGALQWSVVEMLKRYRAFSEVGVRDIAAYNKNCSKTGEDTLPQIVIVIDELADLMMAASKEVEESICRVAQMGRAAGIHLVIATQRPSADVITGLMKANIPSRIAFAVSSSLESRIILDQNGAEKLIGMGDMLFNPVGLGKPLRIQGTFVSDEEREDVINFIKQQGNAAAEAPAELEDYMNKPGDKESEKDRGEDGGALSSEYDNLLPKSVAVAIELKQISVSNLQRRVKLGYSRAARIMDQMEELGVVGPYNGAKPREVIVDEAKWHEIAAAAGIDINVE